MTTVLTLCHLSPLTFSSPPPSQRMDEGGGSKDAYAGDRESNSGILLPELSQVSARAHSLHPGLGEKLVKKEGHKVRRKMLTRFCFSSLSLHWNLMRLSGLFAAAASTAAAAAFGIDLWESGPLQICFALPFHHPHSSTGHPNNYEKKLNDENNENQQQQQQQQQQHQQTA